MDTISSNGLPLSLGATRMSPLWETRGSASCNGRRSTTSVSVEQSADILKVHCCREATSPEGYCPLGRCWRLLSPNFVSRWNPESCFLGQAFDHYARYVMAAMTDSYVRAWTHTAQETTTTKMLVQWLPHTLI